MLLFKRVLVGAPNLHLDKKLEARTGGRCEDF